jgi:hypothetical protein
MRFRRTAALMLGLFGAISCSNSSGPAGSGKLSLVLKDAKGDVQAAVVTISEIDLQGSGGTIVLRNLPITTNLLTLSADVASLVDGFVIPAGTYTQLSFIITGAYIEVDNGNGTSSFYASSPDYAGLPPNTTLTGMLQMPSYSESGLKVILPGNALVIPEGGAELMVLDFDVSQSFGQLAGGSGQWVMHPVVKGTSASQTGNGVVTLTLGAGVTLEGASLADFTTTITGPATVGPVNFSDANSDGTFEADFNFLTPGTYSVTITAPASVTSFTTTPSLPGTLTVPAGGTGTAAFILTGSESGGGT